MAGCTCRLLGLSLASACILLLVAAAICSAQPAEREDAVILGDVDNSAEGCRSLGASGHAVQFTRPEDARFVEAIHIFCARYGAAEAPERDFHVYFLDEMDNVLADVPFAYAEVQRGGPDDLQWHEFKTPAIEVPETFTVALAFEPAQTEGVYVGFDDSVAETHSLIGLPADGFRQVDEVWDWMVRLTLVPTPSEGVEVKLLEDLELPTEPEVPENWVELAWDDGESDDMQSYGGVGPRIVFTLSDLVPEDMLGQPLGVFGLRIYGSRYGGGYDPEETMIEVSFLDADQEPYATRDIPYARFSHDPEWVEVVFDEPVAIETQDQDFLGILLDPYAHQTKGIYFHYNQDPAESHSSCGRVGKDFAATPDREWMIRAWVAPME